MIKFWAIDYVGKHDCELVCDDQLYPTKEAAEAVLARLPNPEEHEVNWYSAADLSNVYGGEFSVDEDLKIHYPEW